MKDIPALLEKNLQELQKSQPKLTARLRAYMDELPALKEPVFRETPAGRWVEGITEKPFFEKMTVLEKRSKAATSAVYLVYGAGCVPYLFHLLRSLPREALSVIVIEPSFDLLLHTLSQTSVFLALPDGCRMSFVVDKDRGLIDEAFAWNVVPIGIFPISKAEAFFHEGQSDQKSMSELRDVLKKEVIYRLTMLGNSPEDTLLGFRHAVLNTPRIFQSPRIKDLKENYGGKPHICVAAGPSLEKNIHLLKDIQDKCVIVACDTILFFLLERGIVPHVVTTVERPFQTYSAWVPRVLNKYRDVCRTILLVSQSVSYPLTAGRWPGPAIVVGKLNVPVDSWYAGSVLGEQLLYSGLSVAHMAIALALANEAPSVALIGQDLAYADSGASHASDAVPDSVLAVEQTRRADSVMVPGSLGGAVETSTIWLTFIQMFERLIVQFPNTPVFDCTEGGALIAGTIISPLSEYIKENIVTPGFSVDRTQVFQQVGKSADSLEERFQKSLEGLERLELRLNDMKEGIARCVAPALTPERRQKLAYEVAVIMDEIHALNPVISFIGQSYTHLSGAVLAEIRFLETVEQVKNWESLHMEIVDSHTYAVEFLKQWLGYARELSERFANGSIVDATMLPDSGEEKFIEIMQGGGNEEIEELDYIQLTDMLSCKDPVDENWSADSLWKAALFLFEQGRADEGRRLMKKAYELMEGTEVDRETIGAFFKDWGKMEAADDLCVVPSFQDALEYLANAREYLPDDDEILSLRQRIFERRRKYLLETEKASFEKSSDVALYVLRNEAEEALLNQDLPIALQSVEKLVWKSLEVHHVAASAHLHWLIKTTVNCLDAADEGISTLSSQILDRLVADLPKLTERELEFPLEFLSYLTKRGVKFSLSSSETNTENE